MASLSYEQQRDAILADRSASFFLQDAIRKLDRRDPCDAVNDVEALLEIARTRIDEATSIGGMYADNGDDEPSSKCTGECAGMLGKNWSYTGTAYGGDDESYCGEGRCYCMFCGEDGDA